MSEKKLTRGQLPVSCLLWIVSSILSLVDWFALRAAVTAVATAIAASVPMDVQVERHWYLRWPAATVDKFALVCFGIVAVASVISFDYLYRDAILKGKVKKRLVVIGGIQVGLLLLSLLAIWIARRVVQG
jgi:hypothetical protein